MKRSFCLAILLWIAGTGQVNAEPVWQEHKTIHFFIYYKDAPVDFVENVAQAAESYYVEITRNLGFTRYESWSEENRAAIYIYQDQQDYVNSGRGAGWSHGLANTRERVIRTFPAAHGFFDSTLPHELGHIIFREFIGFKAALPMWLEEGVAMYQEKAKRWGANKSVRESIKSGKFIPLSKLSTMALTSQTDPLVVDLFYAESASLVYYLIAEEGQHRFVNFCRRLRDGKDFLTALREVYSRFKDMEDLNRVWVNYLKNGR